MNYSIRRTRSESDFQEIIRLHCEAFHGGRKEVTQFIGVWWVLVSNQIIVGFCGIHYSRNYEATTYLCRVAITPKHQGQGLHKRLIRVREQWARRHGIEWIITDTYPDNYASSNSLISCGYKLWQPPKEITWALYKNALYWRKKL